jgi:hypothetical protein
MANPLEGGYLDLHRSYRMGILDRQNLQRNAVTSLHVVSKEDTAHPTLAKERDGLIVTKA